MQPCHHTGHSISWHSLLDATFQKEIRAKTQESELWTLGEPGLLPHTSGCQYHLAFFLCLLTRGQMLPLKLFKQWLDHCHIMGTLQSETSKKTGAPPPHGTNGTWDFCNLGEDSHLLLSTYSLQRSVSCSTATPGRFTPLLSCEAPAWEEASPAHSQAVEIGKAP